MKPPIFEYVAPRTTAEALAILAERGADAKVLAGGQSLVPAMNFRLARPPLLVDINGLTGLDSITEDGDEVVIGALARQGDALRSEIIARRCPPLIEAMSHVGHRTIRNRGTVGGSLAHADPAAELPLLLVALGGRVKVASAKGERWLTATELFVDYLTTALSPEELIVEARFPALPKGTGWAFQEYSRRSGDFALAAVCVTVRVAAGKIDASAIGIAGGGPFPRRSGEAERALSGKAPVPAAFAEAGAAAGAAADVDSDIHGSAEYRRSLIATLVERTVAEAVGRASS